MHIVLTLYLIETLICVPLIGLFSYIEHRNDNYYKRESVLHGLRWCSLGLIPGIALILVVIAFVIHAVEWLKEWAKHDPQKIADYEEHLARNRERVAAKDKEDKVKRAKKKASLSSLKKKSEPEPEPEPEPVAIQSRNEILDFSGDDNE